MDRSAGLMLVAVGVLLVVISNLLDGGLDRVVAAAAIKADNAMAYADAFAAATAIAHDAILLTGDPELLLADAPWRFADLRGALT